MTYLGYTIIAIITVIILFAFFYTKTPIDYKDFQESVLQLEDMSDEEISKLYRIYLGYYYSGDESDFNIEDEIQTLKVLKIWKKV